MHNLRFSLHVSWVLGKAKQQIERDLHPDEYRYQSARKRTV